MPIHDAQPSGILQYAIPIAIFLVVFGLRARRMTRLRPLRIEQLWVVPAIYAVVVAALFVRNPPTPVGWAIAGGRVTLGFWGMAVGVCIASAAAATPDATEAASSSRCCTVAREMKPGAASRDAHPAPKSTSPRPSAPSSGPAAVGAAEEPAAPADGDVGSGGGGGGGVSATLPHTAASASGAADRSRALATGACVSTTACGRAALSASAKPRWSLSVAMATTRPMRAGSGKAVRSVAASAAAAAAVWAPSRTSVAARRWMTWGKEKVGKKRSTL